MKNSKLVYSTETGDTRKKADIEIGAAPKSGSGGPVTVRLDTKARRGKAVTIVSGIPHNPRVIADLAKVLRTQCGAGGTVEGKDILIQGDHRDKVAAKLESLGYKVKKL